MDIHKLKVVEHITPSNSDRRLSCKGSLSAELAFPNTKEGYAKMGVVAHELAEKSLKTNSKAVKYLGSMSSKVPNFYFNIEICRNIQKYLDYVNNIYLNCISSNAEIYVEEPVDYNDYISNGRGKSDAIIYDPHDHTLHIIDLKYGMGKAVVAEGNTQGLLYALGALKLIEGPVKHVVVHIAQPRINSFSSYELTLDELHEWSENLKECSNIRSPSITSCEHCLAKPTCPDHLEYMESLVNRSFLDDLKDSQLRTDTITDKQLINILNAKSEILSWLESVEELAIDRLSDGGVVDGYRLTEGRANRVWDDEYVTEAKLFELLGDAAYSKPKLISAHQAELLLPESDHHKIKHLWSKGVGKKKIERIAN